MLRNVEGNPPKRNYNGALGHPTLPIIKEHKAKALLKGTWAYTLPRP